MSNARAQDKAIQTAGDGLAVYHFGLTAKQGANLTALMARLTEGSRQGYQATWAHYLAWCKGAGRNPANLDAAQALDYLRAHPARRSTQLARLSKLRTIAGWLADVTGNPDLLQAFALLKNLKLPLDMHDHQAPEGGQRVDRHAPRRRVGAKALKKHEVYHALGHEWATPALTARNRAILAAGLYGWLRRSEIARLQWADLNFDERAMAIRGAKKRGADQVDTIDLPDELADMLRAWQRYAGKDADDQGQTFSRVYVFCGVNKGGHLGADKPISGEAVRAVFADVGMMPHDARRTGITRALEAGTPLNIAQKRARHAQGQTTMGYATYVDLAEVRAGTKQGY